MAAKQSHAQAGKRSLHRFDLTAHIDRTAARQFGLYIRPEFYSRHSEAGEVAVL